MPPTKPKHSSRLAALRRTRAASLTDRELASRLTIRLSPSESAAYRIEARRRGITVSALAREALETERRFVFDEPMRALLHHVADAPAGTEADCARTLRKALAALGETAPGSVIPLSRGRR